MAASPNLRVSISKGWTLADERACPQVCLSKELGAFLHKREETPAGYFQRRKVLKTEASHPLRYLTLVP